LNISSFFFACFVGESECFTATPRLLISCERASVDVNYFCVYLCIIIAMGVGVSKMIVESNSLQMQMLSTHHENGQQFYVIEIMLDCLYFGS